MRISVKSWVIIGCVVTALAFLGLYLASILCPSPTEEAFDFFGTPSLYVAIVFSVIWGISILYRIQDRVTWKLFFWIFLLLLIWLFSAILKRIFPEVRAANDFLWHFSYGPLLFMPSLWFILVLSRFHPISVKKHVAVLDSISGILFLLVMTNDLHHWAFYPSEDDSPRHGPLYFIIYDYIFLLLLASIVVLVIGTLHRRNRIVSFIPLFLAVILSLVYSILYIYPGNPLKHILVINSYYIMYTFFSFLIMELNLDSGLLQNNGLYRQYFEKGPFQLALTDKDYRLLYKNEGFTFTDLLKKYASAVKEPYRYTKIVKKGGYLLIQEDMSVLLHLKHTLMSRQEDLKKTTAILKERQQSEGEIERLKTRERLSHSVYQEIEQKSDALRAMAKRLPDNLTPENRETFLPLLQEMQLTLSFLKQRCLFLISGTAEGAVEEEAFFLSSDSLTHDLASLGTNLGVSLAQHGSLPLSYLLKANVIIEELISALGPEGGSLLLFLNPGAGLLKARISPSGPFRREKIDASLNLEQEDEDYLLEVSL